jgi:uncharacterized protein
VIAVLPRLIEPRIAAALATSKVVILEGGRATGKTTSCDVLASRYGWSERIDLADRDIRATMQLDPDRFLRTQPMPCIIDEAQIEPELPLWVKRVVDRHDRPGQFLLTGSARLGRESLGGSDPLVGRAIRLRMWSLTESELAERSSSFIDDAFGDGWRRTPKDNHSEHYTRSAPLFGGLPGIAGVLRPTDPSQWEREIAAYIEGVIPLGVGATRADTGRLLRTFRYLAANSGQLLNTARAANDLNMQASTVRNHLELLEACFLLVRSEADRPMELRVVTSHPRVYAADAGLATWAARAWARQPAAVFAGALMETSVAHDLMAHADAHPDRIVVRHWRDDRNKREVDALLVHPDGRYVAIEVKASTSVGPGDTHGLLAFANAAGPRCHRCVVLYAGDRVLDLTPPNHPCQISAVPRAQL